jgi:hypothetical protein
MTSLFLREVDRAVDTATDEIQKMLDEIEDEKSLPACSDSSCPKFCRGRCACDARKTTPVF